MMSASEHLPQIGNRVFNLTYRDIPTYYLARWDGYQSGARAADGTYYYDVIIDGYKIQGSFSLFTE